MKEKLFHEEAKKLNVPKDEVLAAINLGIEKGEKAKSKPSSRRVPFIISAAATVMIVSSLLVPSISHVLAEAPIVGGMYEKFNDVVGRSLESQQLITQLDEKATSRGIDVSITSSYFDGAVVGVTFEVEGKVKKDRDGNVIGFYEIFNGDSRISETRELVYLKESKDGWSGQIQISYPYSDLPANTTLPLTFMSFGEKEGTWRFDVPIKQLPYEEVALDVEREIPDLDLKLKLHTLIKGNSSAAIDYSVYLPEKFDDIRFEVSDQDRTSNQIYNRQSGLNKGRLTILQDVSGEYLEVVPQFTLHEVDQFITLNQLTPVKIISNRQDLSVQIENMKVDGEQFTIDFQVNNGDRKGREFSLFDGFARSDVTLVKETRKEIYEEPIEHTISVLDKKSLRFRSTFNLKDINDFNKNDYVVRVSLGALSTNLPIELEPIKIDLK
ncbi:DUF4179 domain-containing protein [Bacillus suaedaesalsae]|uniref:DUF4179 domain-containing protein n=1 Tax=Bacillus suaedaesalsae TaxID=2810349 RepID=A0ABS2DEI8_9BACI|nr:DUF4179 domain-containing protein [Bacillus suaedaesalsae]MBM6616877.1 DUF4179 domain-containing protein [Bacillus suaedaesalsae]